MRTVLIVASMLAAFGTSASANAPPVDLPGSALTSAYEQKVIESLVESPAEELAGPIGGALLGIGAGRSDRPSPGGSVSWFRKHAPARASPACAHVAGQVTWSNRYVIHRRMS